MCVHVCVRACEKNIKKSICRSYLYFFFITFRNYDGTESNVAYTVL